MSSCRTVGGTKIYIITNYLFTLPLFTHPVMFISLLSHTHSHFTFQFLTPSHISPPSSSHPVTFYLPVPHSLSHFTSISYKHNHVCFGTPTFHKPIRLLQVESVPPTRIKALHLEVYHHNQYVFELLLHHEVISLQHIPDLLTNLHIV